MRRTIGWTVLGANLALLVATSPPDRGPTGAEPLACVEVDDQLELVVEQDEPSADTGDTGGIEGDGFGVVGYREAALRGLTQDPADMVVIGNPTHAACPFAVYVGDPDATITAFHPVDGIPEEPPGEWTLVETGTVLANDREQVEVLLPEDDLEELSCDAPVMVAVVTCVGAYAVAESAHQACGAECDLDGMRLEPL